MSTHGYRSHRRWPAILAVVLVAAQAPSAAWAGGPAASDWVKGHNAKARLVAGGIDSAGSQVVGVEIEPAPGWHTYWRNPGDSGVPPRFDWAGSGNLEKAEVMWPAPIAIDIGYGVSIGYDRPVTFPVRLRPEEPGRPVEVALHLEYAVCDDICVPLSADLALTVDPRPLPTPGPVAEALARVPASQSPDGDGPRIVASQATTRDGKVVLVVDAEADPAAALFVEGPKELYFAVPPAPEPIGDGRVRFVVEVDGAKTAGDLTGKRVGATLVAGDRAVEHWWPVE